MAGTKRRKPKIIKDKKKRGEWAESVFLVRAGEEGLSASKPWGDSRSFDCVVGRPGRFVAVQVKCTIAKLESGEGYICSTCSSHKPYQRGSFDYLAAVRAHSTPRVATSSTRARCRPTFTAGSFRMERPRASVLGRPTRAFRCEPLSKNCGKRLGLTRLQPFDAKARRSL